MIDWTEIPDGDTWESFARDFLADMGFVIEVDPGRGPDAGRDLIVSEQLSGLISTRKMTWLVSCKHFAQSNKSVGTDVEQNISDRLKQHSANGFIGFYSTIPSSSLVERLRKLKDDGNIEDYQILDGKKIENRFIAMGLSKLAIRYIPKNYNQLRPIQKYIDDIPPLLCRVCGLDLLKESVLEPYSSIIVYISELEKPKHITDIYTTCKGKCDRSLERRLRTENKITSWEDIGDLCNPVFYLKNLMSFSNNLRSGNLTFSESAFEAHKNIFIALSQRTLREITQEDKQRFGELCMLEGL